MLLQGESKDGERRRHRAYLYSGEGSKVLANAAGWTQTVTNEEAKSCLSNPQKPDDAQQRSVSYESTFGLLERQGDP